MTLLYPSLADLLDKVDSRYLLVNIIARRARDISNYYNNDEDYYYEKPVSQAIDEIAAGRMRVTIPDD